MKKVIFTSIIILSIFLILAVILLFSYSFQITGQAIKNYSSFTKAICNSSNFCQDYIISCENEEIISINPITGAVIQHSENWSDPRNQSQREIRC